jgi:predicted RNA-binding Zn-ribbon protein involved in translation (DUF1610 family)
MTAGLFAEPLELTRVRATVAEAKFHLVAFVLVGNAAKWDAAAAQMPAVWQLYADAGLAPDDGFYDIVAMLFLRGRRDVARTNRLVLSLPGVTKAQVQPFLDRIRPPPLKRNEPFIRILPEDRAASWRKCPACGGDARARCPMIDGMRAWLWRCDCGWTQAMGGK